MEIIKISQNANGQSVVSARDLHAFVEATERFSNWCERMFAYGFVENEDFTSVKNFTLVGNGAKRHIDDYALTLDCAKQIAMLQRNDRGRQARQYFIECEKMLNLKVLPVHHTLQNHETRITDLESRASLEHWAGKDSVPFRPVLEEWKETHARNWNKRKEVIRLVGMYARQNNLSRREVYLLVFDEVKTCLQSDIYREAFDGSTLEWLFTNDYIALTLDCANALFTKGGARC